MKRTLVPTEGPKLRLVEAAEKLFAEHGFEVVSVRDITQAAGGNVAAVNYHFGSRDGLVAVVMTRYLAAVHEERLALLDAAEQRWGRKPVPLEEVVAAFVLPLISQMAQSKLPEPLFYRLMGRIFSSHNPSQPGEIRDLPNVSIDRFIHSLGRALPTLTEEDLIWRLHFVVGALTHLLTHEQAIPPRSKSPAGKPDMAATMERFLSFAVAGLRNGVKQAPAAAAAQPLDDGHRPPPQAAAAAQELDNGHEPPPPAVDELPPKRGRKRAKTSGDESPQVLFEF